MAEEMVDVLDEFGHKTGRQIWKREAHDRGIRHGAVHVWIYNSKGEILLQLRARHKEIFPHTLDVAAAGHVSAGDMPAETAIRETKEEIGLDVKEEDLRFIGINRTDETIPPRNWMHAVFDWNYIVCKDVTIKDLTLQTEEVEAVVWMPLDTFESELHRPETNKKFSPHQLYLYDMAVYEIRKALAEKQSKNP